jgi:hypothetical protein
MNEKLIFGGLLFLATYYVLTRNPRCNRGCKTLAQHLLEHGIDDILVGLVG